MEECYKFAKRRNFTFFGVQYNTQCFTAADAGETFNKYGPSSACHANGKGGVWAHNVYQIVCDGGNSKFCKSIG